MPGESASGAPQSHTSLIMRCRVCVLVCVRVCVCIYVWLYLCVFVGCCAHACACCVYRVSLVVVQEDYIKKLQGVLGRSGEM